MGFDILQKDKKDNSNLGHRDLRKQLYKNCPRCGQKLKWNWYYCPFCGLDIRKKYKDRDWYNLPKDE